jgi:dihydrolipoamide dehydrogenase
LENGKTVAVIGGGVAGYVAAIRASQLGGHVTLVERGALGGTCLNRGCIPTKSLLHSADVLCQAKRAGVFGVTVRNARLDFRAVSARKQEVVDRLVGGVEVLMRKNRIAVVSGSGCVVGPGKVMVSGDVTKEIDADKIIIATGSEPIVPPIAGVENKAVINSDEALTLERLPGGIIVVGAGVVGLEFAQIFSKMGVEVTIVEMMPQILPGEDPELAQILEDVLQTEGIKVFKGTQVQSIGTEEDGGVAVTLATGMERQELRAERVLMAVGRRPVLGGVGLENLDIASNKGRIIVNDRMETNVPGIYAIGDVVGGAMLAHVAIAEGKCAAQNAMGIESRMQYQAVPRCIYTSPEVAAVGLTEDEARAKYGNVRVGRFPFRANGKAVVLGEETGVVKVIAEERYGQVVGVGIVGPHATDMIAEAVLGIQLEATVDDFASVIHAHPTLSEAVGEAALSAEGKPIHI